MPRSQFPLLAWVCSVFSSSSVKEDPLKHTPTRQQRIGTVFTFVKLTFITTLIFSLNFSLFSISSALFSSYPFSDLLLFVATFVLLASEPLDK
ncbi:unnamed protein product [Coffea canephora]|uniref:Uncharacterized protein n=1 Tax=Coffea canephora TaxID=49390 RepID=A0A068TYU4_COFCA|nr:unnamed protein product [Coffea canephora]